MNNCSKNIEAPGKNLVLLPEPSIGDHKNYQNKA